MPDTDAFQGSDDIIIEDLANRLAEAHTNAARWKAAAIAERAQRQQVDHHLITAEAEIDRLTEQLMGYEMQNVEANTEDG